MQIVEYTEAVDLTMHGMHDDIYVMHPVAISSMTMQDVRAAAEAGGCVCGHETATERAENERRGKTNDPPEKPCWTGQEKEAGHWKDDGASKRRMVL